MAQLVTFNTPEETSLNIDFKDGIKNPRTVSFIHRGYTRGQPSFDIMIDGDPPYKDITLDDLKRALGYID